MLLKTVILSILTFLFFIILLSCANYEQSADQEAVHFFQKHIKSIQDHNAGQAIASEEYISLFFLESLTDIESSASYGDISYYVSRDSIEQDLANWQNWLEKHQCELNIDSLKLLEKRIVEHNSWIEY